LLLLAVNKILVYLFLLASLPAIAQVGGKRSFEFLNVPSNARLASLGGINVSLADRDVNFIYSNPSLLGDTLQGYASVSYQAYAASIGQATFTYAHHFKILGMMALGVQHMSYGTIQSYDATGAALGDYNSGETALVISKSHQVNNFRLGVNLKGVFSSIAGYRSNALMADVGALFVHPKKTLTIGLVMKNLGVVLSEYSETSKTKIPIDVQFGITGKPQHMPLRFSLTGYNLVASNVTYYNPQDGSDKPGALDKVLRRVNFATEILIHKNVNLMVGYNYRLHNELKLSNGGADAGITFGFSAQIKAVEFVFSRSGFVAGKAGYTFTVSINTKKLLTRR
jgi:hypothetical protein